MAKVCAPLSCVMFMDGEGTESHKKHARVQGSLVHKGLNNQHHTAYLLV